MEEKDVILSQEEEEKVSGGVFDIQYPNPVLKVFCHQCGSENIAKSIKFDSENRKIFVYYCNDCGNHWESLPISRPDQK